MVRSSEHQLLHFYALQGKGEQGYIQALRRMINAIILNSMIICRVNSKGIKIDDLRFWVNLVQALLVEHGLTGYLVSWNIEMDRKKRARQIFHR
jgi:hypothetical protein